MTKYFSKIEAYRKIGRRIRTKVNFSGGSAGTFGRVVDAYSHSIRDWGIDIVWERYPGDTLKDGFSKDGYDEFLEEI